MDRLLPLLVHTARYCVRFSSTSNIQKSYTTRRSELHICLHIFFMWLWAFFYVMKIFIEFKESALPPKFPRMFSSSASWVFPSFRFIVFTLFITRCLAYVLIFNSIKTPPAELLNNFFSSTLPIFDIESMSHNLWLTNEKKNVYMKWNLCQVKTRHIQSAMGQSDSEPIPK